MENILLMHAFCFKVTFEERISGHVTERVNTKKRCHLETDLIALFEC